MTAIPLTKIEKCSLLAYFVVILWIQTNNLIDYWLNAWFSFIEPGINEIRGKKHETGPYTWSETWLWLKIQVPVIGLKEWEKWLVKRMLIQLSQPKEARLRLPDLRHSFPLSNLSFFLIYLAFVLVALPLSRFWLLKWWLTILILV